MYENDKAGSVETLMSATDSASSFEPPEAAAPPMDSTGTFKPEAEVNMDPPSKALPRSAFFFKPVYFKVCYLFVKSLYMPGHRAD